MWADEGERTIVTALQLLEEQQSDRGARQEAQEGDRQMSG